MRSTILGLLIAFAFATLGTAAMIYRTYTWSTVVVTLAMTLALVCTLLAWASSGRRCFCVPFSIVAWVYLAIVFLDPLASLERQLLTSRVLFVVWTRTDALEVRQYYRLSFRGP